MSKQLPKEIAGEVPKGIAESVFGGKNINTIKHKGVTEGISVKLPNKILNGVAKEIPKHFPHDFTMG